VIRATAMNPTSSSQNGSTNMINAFRTLLAGLAATAVLTGCPGAPQPPPAQPEAPEITSFTASASKVRAGESVTLAWETKHATDVRIEDLGLGLVSGVSGASGTVSVAVSESTVFVLSAKNERGARESAAVSVSVEEGAREVLFAATPASVPAGQPVTLAWIADGAKSVALRVKDGEALEVGEQVTAGHLTVRPTAHTTWVLTVDGQAYDASVQVGPVLVAAAATPSSVRPGEEVTVQWLTLGANRVTVEAVGRGTVHQTTLPGAVAEGSFTETVAETVAVEDVVSYVVRAYGANDTLATWTLELYVAGEPSVTEFTAPQWVNEGLTFPMTWKTIGADTVEVLADGLPFYRSQSAAQAAASTLNVPSPAAATTYTLVATWSRGGSAVSEPIEVSPIGAPVVVGFSGTPSGIMNGGDPVALTWEVTNARYVHVGVAGGRTLHEVTGPAATQGTVDVYPNKNETYELTAHNGAGLSIPPQQVAVTVQTPATLTFSPSSGVPSGAALQITGATAPGVTHVRNLPAARNLPGTVFEDIVGNGGNSINYLGPDTTAQLVTLPETFSMPLFGQTVSGSQLSISINGWFAFRTTSFIGPDVATQFPTTLLPGNSFGPLMEDLRDVNGEIYWRLDTVNGVRRLIVQWDNVQIDLNNVAVPGSSFTFQAQLYADGRVVYAYDTLVGITTQRPSIGLQNLQQNVALDAPVVPSPGDTLTFFGASTVPVSVIATTQPFTVVAESPLFEIEIDASMPVVPPGAFSISEVNHDPVAGQAQWIEIRNNGSVARDLQDWVLDFGGGNTHTIQGSLPLPVGAHLVLGQTSTAAEGATVDYVYGTGLTLPATSGGISIGMAGGTYSTLSWTAAGTQGASLQQGAPQPELMTVPNPPPLVCRSLSPYGTNGQLGTPGAPNGRCFPYELHPTPLAFTSIVATGALVPGISQTLHDSFTPAAAPLALPRPVGIFGQLRSQLWVSPEGFVSVLAITQAHWSNAATVTTLAPNGVLAPFWDDLNPSAGAGSVRWQQFDPDALPDTGDEYTVISWENWRVGSGGSINFQIRIDEGAGDIHFLYGAMSSVDVGGLLARGSSATTWIKNEAGTHARAHNINSATNPGINPNSGLRFAFTP
jgi:hypothetical protein